MENQPSFSRSILRVAMVTTLILLVPLVAMQFTKEVDWSIFDFMVMGALIFSIGFSYVLATKYVTNIVTKLAIAFALGATFLLIWTNLAVGLIGGGPHWGNLMYMGVIAVGVIGTIVSNFTPQGMERAMYAMALALVLVAVIALSANMQEYPGSSVIEIIGVNGFFTVLFTMAGLLFRVVAMEQAQRIEKSEG